MLIFLSETKFWSTSDDIYIKRSDYSTTRYEKRKPAAMAHFDGKKSYVEKRGQIWQVSSRRPAKLKDSLEELEEQLKNDSIIYNEWKSRSLLCLIFTTGLIVYLTVDISTGDVLHILFDRYLVGKLLISGITGVLFTDTHIFITCTDNQAILLSFNRSSLKYNNPEKLRKRDPKFQTVELYGSPRRSDRKISYSPENDTVLVWSAASPGEIFPWSPHMKGEDRANVHMYQLQRSKIILSCFHRIENDPLFVDFSKLNESTLHAIEQKNAIKGATSVEWSTYELVNGGLQLVSAIALLTPAPPRCAKLTPSETRVILTCIDGSLLVCDCNGVIHSVKAAFIPSNLCWMGDEALVIVVADDKGRLQCFDTAATPLRMRPVNEDSTLADVSAHSKKQLNLINLKWNGGAGTGNVLNDSFLLLLFEGGPLAVMRFFGTQVIKRWVQGLGRINNASSAVALLKALDWNKEGVTCLSLLHAIVNQLLRSPFNSASELYIQEALGCFHAPRRIFSEETINEFGDQVHDISRKFFHHLLRYGRFEKALSLAIDLGDSDLFTDVKFAATSVGNTELAQEAHAHAQEAISDSEHSTCSRTSCSQCESSNESGSDHSSAIEEEFFERRHRSLRLQRSNQQKLRRREAPPLPHLPTPQQNQPPPIPVVPQTPTASHSIRPNLHQYLDRDTSLWNKVEVSQNANSSSKADKEATHRVVEILPKHTSEMPPHYLYQAVLPEESDQITKKPSWMDKVIGVEPNENFGFYTPVYRSHQDSNTPSTSLAFRTNKDLSLGRSLNIVHPTSIKMMDNCSGTEGRNSGKPAREKNKVKFSDTVTVAVVPEVPRKEKSVISKATSQVTDPKRELADSLPLCHPNDDYLKDFMPITDKEPPEPQSKIKVVHFGMV